MSRIPKTAAVVWISHCWMGTPSRPDDQANSKAKAIYEGLRVREHLSFFLYIRVRFCFLFFFMSFFCSRVFLYVLFLPVVPCVPSQDWACVMVFLICPLRTAFGAVSIPYPGTAYCLLLPAYRLLPILLTRCISSCSFFYSPLHLLLPPSLAEPRQGRGVRLDRRVLPAEQRSTRS